MEYAPILMVFAVSALVGGALSSVFPPSSLPVGPPGSRWSRSSAARIPWLCPRGASPSSSPPSPSSSSSSTSSCSSCGRGPRCSRTSAGLATRSCWSSWACSCSGFSTSGRNGGSNGSRDLFHLQARRGPGLGPKVLHLPIPVRDGVLRHGVHGHLVLALRHRPVRGGPAALLPPP